VGIKSVKVCINDKLTKVLNGLPAACGGDSGDQKMFCAAILDDPDFVHHIIKFIAFHPQQQSEVLMSIRLENSPLRFVTGSSQYS